MRLFFLLKFQLSRGSSWLIERGSPALQADSLPLCHLGSQVLSGEAKITLLVRSLWFLFAERALLPVAVPLPETPLEPGSSSSRPFLGLCSLAAHVYGVTQSRTWLKQLSSKVDRKGSGNKQTRPWALTLQPWTHYIMIMIMTHTS